MYVRTPIKVRYGETDMMGIVYHANYLLYFEDARTHFVEEVAMPYEQIENAGYLCPIYEVNIKYGAPLRYGEEAFVTTRVVKVTPTKITYEQNVYRADMDPERDKPLVSGMVVSCIVERDGFKPTSFKRATPELYEKYRAVAEPL